MALIFTMDMTPPYAAGPADQLVVLALPTRVARPSSRDIAEGDPDDLVPVSDDIEQGGLDMGLVVRVLR